MTISRRHFLLFSGSALVATGAPLRALTATAPHSQTERMDVKLSQMHSSTFKALRDRKFQVQTEQGERLQFKLEHVDNQTHSERLEQFSLVFRETAGKSVPQGTYRFKHPQLGQFNLFVVPTGYPTQDTYQAAFSRLVA